ncbi:DUF5107 domain-containing protein [Naasia sp. SYSU D00057]|uniref:DUF5107 domain-containing protein n=1 Tax=Naasia sp. SYSU D00057 TaxID=2817380 RepID=UPI001B3006C5|nr:DUF5107 domain-containing protein [Naasia sp. SYSU D00057]
MTDADAVPSAIRLPDAPADQQAILDDGGVACWIAPVTIDTYEPGEPDRYPLFLDRRVYQGSSGRVYPIPFTDSISGEKAPRAWTAVHLENAYVRLMLLPEIGGRIHIGLDKTTGYDFFYRNNVIKPALVGLAGPWVSGGVEFNWPQHHRPATFLPVEAAVERDDDGSVVVRMSDLDPLQRMRGTHGIRLRPGSSLIEAEVRLHNRTDEPQTFLWWANVAARSHERYQSFFPTDVRWVADHARRAITAFPQADRPYYGVDYPALAEERPGADRLDIYSSIPVPTSYMVTDTRDSFFGGYDHDARAGFVHWADRSIAPGKKQWTWGDGAVGHAWDAHLTDTDGPYVELMAGVYTDNQPDFSYLAPGEVREFSQYWYPIREMGPAHQATLDAAVSLVRRDGRAQVGVSAPGEHVEASIVLSAGGSVLQEWTAPLSPAAPFVGEADVPDRAGTLSVTVTAGGRELLSWHPDDEVAPEPWVATEPDAPESIASADELYLTGVHLTQYRHPTRSPLPYFEELLRRDPADSRANLAIGAALYRRGLYVEARARFERALRRLTARNLNPESGEASYRLGLVLERLGDPAGAAERFGKAAWDGRWAGPALVALARVLLRTGDATSALDRLPAARRAGAGPEADHLTVLALRRLGRHREADDALAELLRRDALDPVALALSGRLETADPKTPLAVAADLARAGELELALALTDRPTGPRGAFGNPEPMRLLLRAGWLAALGRPDEADRERAAVAASDTTLAFPYGLDDHDALVAALAADPRDAVVRGLLGTWLLDAGRLGDARKQLQSAADLGSSDPVVHRNLAVAVVNTGGDLDAADGAFRRALELAPADARLVFERDVLAELRGVPAAERLARIEGIGSRALGRDDLTLRLVNLLLDLDRVDDALAILTTRRFQPFEGGEGQAIAAYDRATLARAAELLPTAPAAAARLLRDGIVAPANLGEGRHPAVPMAERLTLLGDALAADGDREGARRVWEAARSGPGALAVAPRPVEPDDFWRGIAHVRLGEIDEAAAVWDSLEARAGELQLASSAPDYFATSLPELLLFDTDTAGARARAARLLRDLAEQGRTRSRKEAAA